jgi:hypothetical protein
VQLPKFDIKLRHTESGMTQVFDILRNKWVALTPEEWVRQHFVNYLINDLGYPKSLMANEVGLKLNDTARRCDTVIYSRDARPIAIVEYKAEHIKITQQVFDQIARYNMVIHANVLIVSNGNNHYCCRFDYEQKKYRFLKEIPVYDEIL